MSPLLLRRYPFRKFPLALLGVLAACSDPPDAALPPDPPPHAPPSAPAAFDWKDVAAERGLDYENRSGEGHKATILEANGAGVALLDLQSDGDLDVVFAQGLGTLTAATTGPGADLEVFWNDGTGHFERAPGPGLAGWWTGLATGDVDADGDTDLVAGGYGDLVVLLQGPDGTLEPGPRLLPPAERLAMGEEREPGSPPPSWVTSLALFDADLDGVLDLYVGRYLDLDPLAPPIGALGEGELAVPCRWKGYEVFCGPAGMVPQSDRLLLGSGDGNFAPSAGLPQAPPGFTLALAPFDADGDGDSDLYVANDSSPNLLLINDGKGNFADHGYTAGVALSHDGRAEAGMGVAIGDIDRDGRLDLAVTNFSEEPTALYLGAAFGFSDRTYRYGMLRESRRLLSWGVHLEDFDGDGWLELFTANGHVYPQADLEHTGSSYGQADTLWRLGPEPKARRVQALSDDSLLAAEVGTRGSAVGDVNGDGTPDLVLARIDGPAALGLGPANASTRLIVRCLGPRVPGTGPRRTPADAMGAQVLVVVGTEGAAFGLLREVQTGRGYQSASASEMYFGLGEATEYASLSVRWPSGRVEELPGGKAGRRLVVREGEGIVHEEELQ